MRAWPAALLLLALARQSASARAREVPCDGPAQSCTAPEATRGSSLVQSRQLLGKGALGAEAREELEGPEEWQEIEELEEPDAPEPDGGTAVLRGEFAQAPQVASLLAVNGSGGSAAVFPCPASCQWCSPSASDSQVVTTKDVQYGRALNWATGMEEDLYLDVYEVPSGDTKPVIVVVHGGSYSTTSSKSWGWIPRVSTLLARHGFLVLSIEYRRYGEHCKTAKCGRMEPNPKYEAPAHDTLAAVRYVRRNAAALRADPSRISMWGCSAGATTAAHAMIHNWGEGSSGNAGYTSEVQAVIALSGTSRTTYKRRTSGVPPYLAFHNEVDSYVPYSAAVQTRDYLDSIGSPNELITLPGSGHCPDIFQGHGSRMEDFMGFLARYLQLPGATCPGNGEGSTGAAPPTPSPMPATTLAPPATTPAPLPTPSTGCPTTCSSPSCNKWEGAWAQERCIGYCNGPYQGTLWCSETDYGAAVDCTSCSAAVTLSPSLAPTPAPTTTPPAAATPSPTPSPATPPPPAATPAAPTPAPTTTPLPTATLAPTTAPPQSGTFEGVDGGADRVCRGAHASDNQPSYWTTHWLAPFSLQECQQLCVATEGCTGVEVNFNSGRCEVWTEPIRAWRANSGYACYRYV